MPRIIKNNIEHKRSSLCIHCNKRFFYTYMKGTRSRRKVCDACNKMMGNNTYKSWKKTLEVGRKKINKV